MLKLDHALTRIKSMPQYSRDVYCGSHRSAAASRNGNSFQQKRVVLRGLFSETSGAPFNLAACVLGKDGARSRSIDLTLRYPPVCSCSQEHWFCFATAVVEGLFLVLGVDSLRNLGEKTGRH